MDFDKKSNVVAVTCLGSGHPLLSKRTFDMCIIDESTQVLQPSLFRTIFASQKFVLIGDPDQLPPLVRNQEAIKKGMSESLFERLQTLHANVTLNLNYRMNKPITQLANGLTYNGELLTANDDVANSHLHLPKFNELLSIHRNNSWILEALDESLASSVRVLDTGPVWNLKLDIPKIDQLKAAAVSVQNDGAMNCWNPYETAVIAVLVQALLKAGVSSDCIGIIAPYRAQVAQLNSLLHSTNIEISTIDQFQGRDKNVVLFSATKSTNFTGKQTDERYEVLADTRRINVAITRAKQKLIIVGDRETLKEYKPFHKMFSCLDKSCFLKLVEKPEEFCDIVGLLDKM